MLRVLPCNLNNPYTLKIQLLHNTYFPQDVGESPPNANDRGVVFNVLEEGPNKNEGVDVGVR